MWDAQLILQGTTLYLTVAGGIIGLILLLIFAAKAHKYKKWYGKEGDICRKLQEQGIEWEQFSQTMNAEREELQKKYTLMKETSERLEKLAYSDSLTELPNRKAFEDMLDNVMKTLRKGETVAVLDLDLDDFKEINDRTGAMYGDQLLIDVAYRLRDALGENDFLAKIGGDEFAVLTQNITDMAEYDDMLRKLLKVFSYPFMLGAREQFISVSMGVALVPKDGTSMPVLMKRMAIALNAAKENGKNTYVYFNEALNEQGRIRLELQSELRTALEQDQFFLLYQPILELETKKIEGFEALLRWKHPERGILKPEDFLLAAEENGFIVSIGKQVLQKACIKMEQWRNSGYQALKMGINLSARQIQEKELASAFHDIFFATGADPKAFEFELTEHAILSHWNNAVKQIEELHEFGSSICIDNFGTDQCSMKLFEQLPVTGLKISRKMLEDFLEDNKAKRFLETILSFANALDLKTVAVGIEEVIQEEFLHSYHCRYGQGYIYSWPLEEKEADELLKNGSNVSWPYDQKMN